MPSTQDILSQIAQNESGGNPTAQSSTSSASGLYGFLTGTWQQYAPQVGVSVSQYPTAASAPASVQTQVASITPLSNWTCQGCDANFSQYASQNGLLSVLTPSDYGSGTSVYGDGSYLSGLTGNSFSVDPFSSLAQPGVGGLTDPNAGVIPYQYGTPLSNPTGTAGTGSAGGTDWWATFWNIIGNLLQRVGLGLLGIILIGAAAWAASHGEFGKGAQRALRSV